MQAWSKYKNEHLLLKILFTFYILNLDIASNHATFFLLLILLPVSFYRSWNKHNLFVIRMSWDYVFVIWEYIKPIENSSYQNYI